MIDERIKWIGWALMWSIVWALALRWLNITAPFFISMAVGVCAALLSPYRWR